MIFRIFIFALFAYVSPTTISLSELIAGSIQVDVEIGSRLYVASTDLTNLLQNVYITDGAGIYTAYTLSKLGVNTDGTMMAYEITTNKLTVSGSDGYDYSTMTGFIYITTAIQAKDSHFMVYPTDVKSLISTDMKNATMVFLNYDLDIARRFDYIPLKSTRITNLTNTNFRIYWDEPSATWNNGSVFKSQLVFSNPFQNISFENIDPIQMNTDVFYIWIENGLSLSIEPTWEDPNSIVSSGYTSTGMIMSTYSVEDIKFDLKKDARYGGQSGFMIISKVANITSFELGGSFIYNVYPRSFFNIEGGVTAQTSDYFSITSAPPHVGRFAVQYFQQQGDLLPTTVSTTTLTTSQISTTTTTTTTVSPTTTSNASRISIILVFLIAQII